MATVLYFAYGSNLLRERLLERCPNLSYAGRATLPAHRLTFDKVSSDESGKCAFEPDEAEEVLGVLWSVPEKDLPALDHAEGVGHGYERRKINVMRSGERVEAMTYVASRCQPGLQPYDWYLALVIAGAVQQGLPDVYVDRLRGTLFLPDPELQRKTRLAALVALAHSDKMGEFDALAR